MRWPDLAAAQAAVSDALGSPAELRACARPLPLHHLSPAEQATYSRLPAAGGRRHDWLVGRAALRSVLPGVDTSQVAFPHRCLSLTHASGVAVAARCDGAQAGLGVDFEAWRRTDTRMARFFLHEEEWDGECDLLRLWTVKEALYKATPGNRGAMLLDYRLDGARSTVGSARDGRGNTFTYVSGQVPRGPLAVAVCEGGTDAPVR